MPLSFLATTIAGAQSASAADTLRGGVALSRRALTMSIRFDTSRAGAATSEPGSDWRITVSREDYSHSSRLWLVFRESIDAADRSAFHPITCRVLTDAYSCNDSATDAHPNADVRRHQAPNAHRDYAASQGDHGGIDVQSDRG